MGEMWITIIIAIAFFAVIYVVNRLIKAEEIEKQEAIKAGLKNNQLASVVVDGLTLSVFVTKLHESYFCAESIARPGVDKKDYALDYSQFVKIIT